MPAPIENGAVGSALGGPSAVPCPASCPLMKMRMAVPSRTAATWVQVPIGTAAALVAERLEYGIDVPSITPAAAGTGPFGPPELAQCRLAVALQRIDPSGSEPEPRTVMRQGTQDSICPAHQLRCLLPLPHSLQDDRQTYDLLQIPGMDCGAGAEQLGVR